MDKEFRLSNVAMNRAGQPILADSISPNDWDVLKATYAVEDFRMLCCSSPAIPKTSSNGLQFFAHYDDECGTAPETKWHREAKALIVANLAILGLECQEEMVSKNKTAPWKADTYFEIEGRRIVIELQRSYQHLNHFLRRQQRYLDAGVESYWLLRHENFLSLMKASGKHRLKWEFGGKFPAEGSISPCIRELPVAYLETGDAPVVKGVNCFQVALGDWLMALIERRFRWDNGIWMIV
jgi:competence protein CoiA